MKSELVEMQGTSLIQFSVTEAAIAKMKEEYLVIVVSDFDDKVNYDLARSARLNVKEKRVAVEKKRKELKAESLKYGKNVDSKAKLISDELEAIEDYLQGQEDIVKLHQKKIEEAAELKRQADIAAELKLMEEEKAQMIADRLAIAQEKQILIDEREKIELEKKLREEAEANRILSELRHAEEIIKLAKEAEEEKIRIAEKVELDKLQAIKEAKEALELAEEERIKAIQKAKSDAFIQAAKEAEDLRLEEVKRLALIESARLEALRLASIAPDKVKLTKLISDIEAIDVPKLSESANAISIEVITLLKKVTVYITAKRDKL